VDRLATLGTRALPASSPASLGAPSACV